MTEPKALYVVPEWREPESCDLALYRVSAAITFDVWAKDERDAMARRVSVAGVDQDKLAVGPAIHVQKVEEKHAST